MLRTYPVLVDLHIATSSALEINESKKYSRK
jgi:hypothetical protein